MPGHEQIYDYFIVPLGGEDTNSRVTDLMRDSGTNPDSAQVNLHLGERHPTSSYHVPFETMLVVWFSMAPNQWLRVKCYRKSKKRGTITSVPLPFFEKHKNSPMLQARLKEIRRLRAQRLQEMAPMN